MDFSKLEPIRHSYKPRWIIQAFTYLFNTLAIALPILLAVSYIFAIKRVVNENLGENLIVLLVLQIISIAVSPISCLTASNWYTEITSNEIGLHITFFWRHVTVRWKDIVDLRPIAYPIYKRITFAIRTRSLTPFHRVYGILFSFTLLPTLIYHKDISNRDELERRVKAAIRQNRKESRKTEYNLDGEM